MTNLEIYEQPFKKQPSEFFKKILMMLALVCLVEIGTIIGVWTSYNITAIATYTLVCVTGYYAINSQRMVEEMGRQRRMENLDKKLTRLYSPLWARIIEENKELSLKFETKDGFVSIPRDIEWFYLPEGQERFKKMIENNMHLASDLLRKKFSLLLHDLDKGGIDKVRVDLEETLPLICDEFNKFCREYERISR